MVDTLLSPIKCGAAIEQALREHRFETARRMCLAALDTAPNDRSLLYALHQSYRYLGDIASAVETLSQLVTDDSGDQLTPTLWLAEDYHILRQYDFYRGSAESEAGISGDEYSEKMDRLADQYFQQAMELIRSDEDRQLVAEVLRRCEREQLADTVSQAPQCTEIIEEPVHETGTLSGTILLTDGQPAADITVTLGLALQVDAPAPASYLSPELGYSPTIHEQQALTARTGVDGSFTITDIPAGQHEFVAVTLDQTIDPIMTRFVAHGVTIEAGRTTTLDVTVHPWQSAPAYEVEQPFPEQLTCAGRAYRRVQIDVLNNPFYYDFPRQLLSFSLPADVTAEPDQLLLLGSHDPETAVSFQLTEREVSYFAELPAKSERVYALYQVEDGVAQPFTLIGNLQLTPSSDGRSAVLDTGCAAFRIPYGERDDAQPPILAVRGEDLVWRGSGRFCLPDDMQVISRSTTISEQGPLLLTIRHTYQLSTGGQYEMILTAHRNEPYLLVHERCPAVKTGGFEFSLHEFSGGRGFLYWTPEHGNRHWTTLAAEEALLARLQEQTPWWIPPQGFGYAMTKDGLDERDYIGVFTIRRGEWIDRDFAKIAFGPGEGNEELDWPYPEMMGSTFSMITAHTDTTGDAYFRFGWFDGERKWGLLVSTLEQNDGPFKEISWAQHKNSSPRLQEFKSWKLDQQDQQLRPWLMARHEDLATIREKRQSPVFARYWKTVEEGKRVPGAVSGITFIGTGDPVVAWRKKRQLVDVAQIYARMILLGRDFADMYSPVGARCIAPWAEDYDCIVASGVFTPEEERLVRQFFLLMAHMYESPDFMNWQFNARNANFEADRAATVGIVAMAFADAPDAVELITHAKERLQAAMSVYCTPGSGKWYENPACYYLQALKCWGKLAWYLSRNGWCDITKLPRFKSFLSWGVSLLTPMCPHDYGVMMQEWSDAEYRQLEQVRRIPPVGDHAQLGPWVPDDYPILARCFQQDDPEFAQLLRGAYQAGGANGGYHGNAPLMLASLSEEDLQPTAPPVLASRRLEGFGALIRDHVHQEDEVYILIKQGPGGYRFHRTEGSFIFFADGKPLIYDGGEAGETWRHSTLSFYDVHMPLAPGHVEKFSSLSSMDFVQGVHPVALKPGDPVFLSDNCHHELVEVAYQRMAVTNPANVRSFAWVHDEYLVVHDDLQITEETPCYWHLQVIAQHETGDATGGYRFHGRYGTDLQVVLPNQTFVEDSVDWVRHLEVHRPPEKSFTMRHLTVRAEHPRHYLAVLRPLSAGKTPVQTQMQANQDGVVRLRVTGEGISDTLFFARQIGQDTADGVTFSGRYGAVLHRPQVTSYLLNGAGTLQSSEVRLVSDGPSVELRHEGTHGMLIADGHGTIQVEYAGHAESLTLSGEKITRQLSR